MHTRTPPVTLLQATFISPLAGSIYFKQVGQEENVTIWGKLYKVNGMQTTYNHSWVISQNPVSLTQFFFLYESVCPKLVCRPCCLCSVYGVCGVPTTCLCVVAFKFIFLYMYVVIVTE